MSGSRWVYVKYTHIWYVKNTKVGILVLFTVLCIICGSCNVCTTFCLLVCLWMDTWIGFTFWILCSEHGCTNVFKLAFSSFGYTPRSEIARLGVNYMFFFFFFLRKNILPYCFPQQLYHFTFPTTVCKDSSFFMSSLTFAIFFHFFFYFWE